MTLNHTDYTRWAAATLLGLATSLLTLTQACASPSTEDSSAKTTEYAPSLNDCQKLGVELANVAKKAASQDQELSLETFWEQLWNASTTGKLDQELEQPLAGRAYHTYATPIDNTFDLEFISENPQTLQGIIFRMPSQEEGTWSLLEFTQVANVGFLSENQVTSCTNNNAGGTGILGNGFNLPIYGAMTGASAKSMETVAKVSLGIVTTEQHFGHLLGLNRLATLQITPHPTGVNVSETSPVELTERLNNLLTDGTFPLLTNIIVPAEGSGSEVANWWNELPEGNELKIKYPNLTVATNE